jgi:LacI family transcriptional regulator
MASLADISRLAGVSIATASRVLGGSSHPVSEATRSRVMQAAEELGYRPSELARALVKRTSRIVGVIVGDVVDPYFAEIARGVEDVAAARGHLTMVCSADRRPAAELAHLSVLRDYHAAGVVFAGSGYAEESRAIADAVTDLQARGAVVVALAARELDCPHVVVDNVAAARVAAEHLLDLGHRRIAFVEGPAGLLTSAQRLQGFEAAMTAAGAESVRLPGGFEYEAGDHAADELLAAGPLPDAILAVNDEVAIGLLTGLRRGGVSVPGDVSVAGIDDTRPARLVDLTSVSLPLRELGERAAHAILAGEGGDAVLPHRLVTRATTAPRTT